MIRFFLALILTAFCTCLQQAQTQSTATAQQQESALIIDGAVHPELIPDAVAYRLYFVAISVPPNPTNEDRKRQQAQLNMIGLREADRNNLVSVIAEFRIAHDNLATLYNQAAAAAVARNEAPDVSGFVKQLDELVQATRETLKLRLTPEGMMQLEAFVQSEKKRMRIHAGAQ